MDGGATLELGERKRAEGRCILAVIDPIPAGAAKLELLASIVSKAPVPIFLKARDGTFIYVNDAFISLGSWAREDIIGRTDAELYPEHIALGFQMDDRVAMESTDPVESVRPFIADGEHRIFKSVKFPVRGMDGQVLGVCGIAVDITDSLLEQKGREAQHQRDISAKPFERRFATLTHQEAKIAELLSLGYADKEIAESLSLTPDTVRHHVSHVLKKLRKRSRTQAVIEMLRHRRES